MTATRSAVGSSTASTQAARYDLGPVLRARQVARGAMGEIHRLDTGAGSYAVKRLLWEALCSRAEELTELSAWLAHLPDGDPVTCHRDLKAENTLVGPDGHCWLLDWDNVGPLAPWRELGILLVHWWDREQVLGELTRTYQQAGGPAYPRDATILASGLAQWLNHLAGQAALLLDPSVNLAAREYALPRVTGLLRDIPGAAALGASG